MLNGCFTHCETGHHCRIPALGCDLYILLAG